MQTDIDNPKKQRTKLLKWGEQIIIESHLTVCFRMTTLQKHVLCAWRRPFHTFYIAKTTVHAIHDVFVQLKLRKRSLPMGRLVRTCRSAKLQPSHVTCDLSCFPSCETVSPHVICDDFAQSNTRRRTSTCDARRFLILQITTKLQRLLALAQNLTETSLCICEV